LKICIVTYSDYFNIPYIHKYEKILQESHIKYDIILWNRSENYHLFENTNNYFIFQEKVKRNKLSKIIPFLKWKHFVLCILKQKQYDKLILLTTVPSVLISRYLLSHYKEKYLLDIRDFTYENFLFYNILVNCLIEKSCITTISSEGFKSWLNKSEKIYLTHNITNENLCVVEENVVLSKNQIVIGFVGGIRYDEINIEIIRQLANNSRFNLKYIGQPQPQCVLKTFCNYQNINNVEFFPRFNNEDKPFIYKKIDIINSVYGSKTQEVSTALPNKLYDCILFHKPIMVSKGTYLEKIVLKYHLGFAIEINHENLEKKIDQYIDKFDSTLFLQGCNDLLKKVVAEENYVNLIIKEKFIKVKT
jgi:hypothetical protein